MEPKNLVKENLFSKGELFLENVEYIGPYNVKADGSYYTLSKFITGKSKQLTTKKTTLYQDLLKITGGIDGSTNGKGERRLIGWPVGGGVTPSRQMLITTQYYFCCYY